MNKNIETFLGCDKDYAPSRVVVFGAPFDSTASYRPGARFAPKTMRAESYSIETYSPYIDKDLVEDAAVFDGGDLELCFGDTEKALEDIYKFAEKIIKDDKFPFLIGGEHLVSLPAIKAAYEKYPDLRLVHFDAHTDLRDDYLGAKLSHATVIRRAHDFLGDGRIFQFGIRSGDKPEFLWAKNHTRLTKVNFVGLEDTLAEIADKHVYLTVDLDVLDPAVFPGTGTPEAGGVSFRELLNAVTMVFNNVDVVGCDMVELSPPLDPNGISTATALKLMREVLFLADGKKSG